MLACLLFSCAKQRTRCLEIANIRKTKMRNELNIKLVLILFYLTMAGGASAEMVAPSSSPLGVKVVPVSGTSPGNVGASVPSSVQKKISADEPLDLSVSQLSVVAPVAKVDNKTSDIDDNGDEVTLDTVDINAVQLAKGAGLNTLNANTLVISRQQILEKPEQDVQFIVNHELGVWTQSIPQQQQDPTGATACMRGMCNSGGKVLVMLDGVPINDGMFRTVDWSMIPRDTIEKIEIVRGGAAASYWGNMATAGVINIITRAPGKTENNVGVKYGSWNTRIGEASATIYNGETYQTSLHLNTNYSDGYNLVPTLGQEGQNGINMRVNATGQTANNKSNNLLWNNYWTPDADTKIFLKINAHELLNNNLGFVGQGNQWYKGDARGGLEWKYSATGSLNANMFYNFSQMNKQNAGAIGTGAYAGKTFCTVDSGSSCTSIATSSAINASMATYTQQLEDIAYQTGGGSGFLSDEYDFGSTFGAVKDIKIGVDIKGTTTNDAMQVFGANTPSSSSTPYSSVGTKNASNVYTNANNMFEGVFAQATWHAASIPLTSTLGLRGDFWQKNNAYADVTPYSSGKALASSTNQYSQGNWAQFNPRWGLTYDPIDELSFKGSIYRNMSAPGMNQLYRTYFSSGTIYASNANLAPEQNFGQELTAAWRPTEDLEVEATFFHNWLSNYIQSVQSCGTTVGKGADGGCGAAAAGIGWGAYANAVGSSNVAGVNQNQNVGNATTMGWEGSIRWKALDSLTLDFGITQTEAYLNGLSPTANALNNAALAGGSQTPLVMLNKQLPYVQPWTLTQAGNWNLSDLVLEGLKFNYIIKAWPAYYSSFLQQQYGSTGNYNTGGANSTAVTGALTGDIGLSYHAFKQVQFSLNVQNVGNRYYLQTPSSGSTPGQLAMPFNVMAGVRINW